MKDIKKLLKKLQRIDSKLWVINTTQDLDIPNYGRFRKIKQTLGEAVHHANAYLREVEE